jgi:uncharacterized protein YjeT (DUF2065 family)
VLFIYVQRCQAFVTAVTSGCGPVMSPRSGKRLRSPPHEQPSRGLRILGPMRALVSPSGSILVSLPLCLKPENCIIYLSLL